MKIQFRYQLIVFGIVLLFNSWSTAYSETVSSPPKKNALTVIEETDSSEIIDTTAKFENNSAPEKNLVASEEPQQSVLFLSKELKGIEGTYDVGFYLTTGGLVAMFLPPPISTVGGITRIVGVPMMGSAAGRANSIALSVDPRYIDPGSGWGWYGTGMSMEVIGSVWFVYELLSHLEIVGATPISFPVVSNPNVLVFPLLTIFTGLVCEGTGWYKFSVRHRKAKQAILDYVLFHSK